MIKYGLIIWIRKFSPLNTRCTIGWMREKKGSQIKYQDAVQNQVQNIAQNLAQNQFLHQNRGHLQRQKQLKRKWRLLNLWSYDGSFLYQEKERCRLSESVPYGWGRISQISSKSRNSWKRKQDWPKQRNKTLNTKWCSHQPRNIHHKRFTRNNQRKNIMGNGRESSRPSRNQSHLILQLYQMLIQKGIWENYMLVGVMVMIKRSVIFSNTQRVYFNEHNCQC